MERLLLWRPTEEATELFEDRSLRLDLRVKSASVGGAGTEDESWSEARAELLVSLGFPWIAAELRSQAGIAAELRAVVCSRGGGVRDLLRERCEERPLPTWGGESSTPPEWLSTDTSNEPGRTGAIAVFCDKLGLRERAGSASEAEPRADGGLS